MQTESASPTRQAAVIFIFFAVVIDVLGFGVIIPVLPKLIEGFEHGNTARAAEIFGLFGTVWALMQFIFAPLLGAVSDRFGRRRVLLISCFGLGIDYIVMALAPSVGWLLIGRIASGICASSFNVANAYIADVTPPEKRAQAFGMIGAAFGVGFVIGPAIGGMLGSIDPRLPFWGAAGLSLLNAAYGLFVLPESLPPEKRDAFAWKKANPVGALNLLRAHPELSGLATVNFLFQLAHCVLPSAFVLYTGYRYHWGPGTVGITLMLVGVLNVIVQALLVKRIVAVLGERGTMCFGLLAGAAGFAGTALAPTADWAWAMLPLIAFMGLFQPGFQSVMTKRVSAQDQGKLQGANASIMGIAGLFGPSLFTQTLAHSISGAFYLPGATFLVAAGLLMLALMIAIYVVQMQRAEAV